MNELNANIIYLNDKENDTPPLYENTLLQALNVAGSTLTL